MRLTCTTATGLLCAALAVSAAGCGQSAQRDAVRDVAGAFGAALEQRDGRAACALLSRFLADEVAAQARRPCPQAILELELSTGPVERVHVYVTAAQVALPDGEHAYLDRARAGWRLTAVGCRFEDGRARDRPASCEAQA